MKKKRCQGGKCADPAWRKARAIKAGLASKAVRIRLVLDRAQGFETKAHAWAAGYKAGLQYTRRRRDANGS